VPSSGQLTRAVCRGHTQPRPTATNVVAGYTQTHEPTPVEPVWVTRSGRWPTKPNMTLRVTALVKASL